jgi:putative flippase GtrA
MIPAPVKPSSTVLQSPGMSAPLRSRQPVFALVGVVNTAVDFSVFWTAANFLRWPLVLANVVAWLVAVTFSYAMNSFITFGPESGRILRWRDYASFGASGVAGMVASTATLLALSYFIPVLLAKLDDLGELRRISCFRILSCSANVHRAKTPDDSAGHKRVHACSTMTI